MCQVIINFFPGYHRRRLIILPTLFRASRLRQNSRVHNKRVGWNKYILYGKVNSVQEACAKCFVVDMLKGVSSKPSGKHILGPDFCFSS